MRISSSGLVNFFSFSKLFRQLEQETETVVKVLQPGPLGIIEHKFSAEEILNARATVQVAVENWQRNAKLWPEVFSSKQMWRQQISPLMDSL